MPTFTNEERAKDYLSRARKLYEEGGRYLKSYDYTECVRKCQESVELSVKSMFLLTKGFSPRGHDISDKLSQFVEELPEDPFLEWFKKENYPKLIIKIKTLALWRECSFYGDDKSEIPASNLFGEWEAKLAFGWAGSAYSDCFVITNILKLKSQQK